MNPPLRVLIADDSPTVRCFLRGLIDEAPDLTVLAEAGDGQEAVELATRLRPDIISMDIRMPRLDGLAATRHLMANAPTPIVIVSGYVHRQADTGSLAERGRSADQNRPADEEVDLAFLALQAGALAVLETPPGRKHPDFPARRDRFLSTLRTMAGVSLVRRWAAPAPPVAPDAGRAGPLPPALAVHECPRVVVIGASAGGPMALHQVLGALPADLPAPVAIVQHMAEGFVEGLARWLDRSSPLRVTVAHQGQIVRAGEAIVAPAGMHLTLRCAARGVRVVLRADAGGHPYQPSVDALFDSVARHFGAGAVGVLLTGMGADGAQGLLALRRGGAHTLVQDEATCLVYGMPGMAVALGAAEQILPLEQLAAAIVQLL